MKDKKNVKVNCFLSCCPGISIETSKNVEKLNQSNSWLIKDSVLTRVGEVPRVSTELTFKDIIGSWKVRWGINRMNYKISPGLYCVGNPDSQSPVMVSANYKMSFDRLRKALAGIDTWIMVLDTKGINVWCSAGKGTFGTDEVVSRIAKVGLSQIVSHKTLILPQLSAPGVAAHEVTKRSGFKVVYGPVKARDVSDFIKAGMKATSKMRKVKFTFLDRIILTPVELAGVAKIALIVFGVFLLSNLLGLKIFSIRVAILFIGAILVGSVLVPALLPWIPGRAFAFKGWLMGIFWALAVNIYYGWLFSASPSWKTSLVNFLTLPALSSFLSMNFTGSSTYTSLSGVLREMKIALSLIIISGSLGLALWIAKIFIRL